MDGGDIHERVLLGCVETAFRERGASTRRQAPCGSGTQRGFIDLAVEVENKRLAIEAELSGRRIANDVRKAIAWGADQLWIVVPNQRVLRAARRAWKRQRIEGETIAIFFLTLGQALQQVSTDFSGALSEEETEKQTNTRFLDA